MPIRVLIVDDQRLVRAGFRVILAREPDIEVVGEAGTGREALGLAERRAPDVVLMDIRMPDMDGLEATRRLLAARGDRIGVLMLTTFDADEYVYEALRAGASGFLLKDVREDQLVEAVRVVAAGDGMVAPGITKRLIARFAEQAPRDPGAAPGALAGLTPREREVALEIARGASNAEIAERFVLSEHTVKTHVARVLAKLGLRDRTQLVVLAYETGFVVPGQLA
jgi:DNA-binding NarL/FixJ family response regulator